MEVGMGGRYDATNIIDLEDWKSYSCGVTLLDYDHTRVLGSTLEEIAWEKGGIFRTHKLASPTSQRPGGGTVLARQSKAGAVNIDRPASHDRRRPCFFTIAANRPSCLEVLRHCALIEGDGNSLCIVGGKKGSSERRRIPETCHVGLPGEHQRTNAELAVALCDAVMKDDNIGRPLLSNQPTSLDSSRKWPSESDILQSLGTVNWPGRCQTVELVRKQFRHSNASVHTTLRLDGAHTLQSLSAGLNWFQQQTGKRDDSSGPVLRSLIFNCSHERNPVELLKLLVPMGFRSVYFCRPDSERPSAIRRSSAAELLLSEQHSASTFNGIIKDEGVDSTPWQDTLADIWKQLEADLQNSNAGSVSAAGSVSEALTCLSQEECPEGAVQEVLVTGSLYLVGSALAAAGWSEPTGEGRIITA
jgi:folylpolyglutamate synthase